MTPEAPARPLGRAVKAVVGAATMTGALLGALSGTLSALTANGADDVGRRIGALALVLLVAVPVIVGLTSRSDLAEDADRQAGAPWWRAPAGAGGGLLAGLAFIGMATTTATIFDGVPARVMSAAVRGDAGGWRIAASVALGAVAALAAARRVAA